MTIFNSLPFTLTNGTTADATQVMSDLNQIVNDGNTNAAHNGANSDITSITGLTTPLTQGQGGTGLSTGLNLLPWAVAAGTADAITATYAPAISSLADGLCVGFRATAANATTTPTFAPNGLTAHTIVKEGGTALVAGDIPANLAECVVRYNLANTRWELLNPAVPLITQPTTWTPTDASGAGLALTINNAIFYKIGKLITVAFDISWPATADGTSVLIGGLPGTSFNTTNRIQCGALSLNNGLASAAVVAVTPNATTFTLQTIAAVRATNANMSTATARGSVSYFTA